MNVSAEHLEKFRIIYRKHGRELSDTETREWALKLMNLIAITLWKRSSEFTYEIERLRKSFVALAEKAWWKSRYKQVTANTHKRLLRSRGL